MLYISFQKIKRIQCKYTTIYDIIEKAVGHHICSVVNRLRKDLTYPLMNMVFF